jgi:hypothetical protein
MERITTGAVTAQYDFHKATNTGDPLFSVCAGVPLRDAFNELSLLLASVESATEGLAMQVSRDDVDAASPWAAVHVMTFCSALVQSMHQGLIEHEKNLD